MFKPFFVVRGIGKPSQALEGEDTPLERRGSETFRLKKQRDEKRPYLSVGPEG